MNKRGRDWSQVGGTMVGKTKKNFKICSGASKTEKLGYQSGREKRQGF